MRFSLKRTQSLAVSVACAVSFFAAIVFVVGYNIHPHVSPGSADALLQQADDLSWNNQWIAAESIYKQAELMYAKAGNRSKALYARVSQIPPHYEAGSIPSTIFELTKTLSSPEAQDPESHLRILEIRGMIETNYDAGMRRCTLHGRKNILKRLLIHVGSFNISLVMRKMLGAGKPRELANRMAELVSGAIELLFNRFRSMSAAKFNTRSANTLPHTGRCIAVRCNTDWEMAHCTTGS